MVSSAYSYNLHTGLLTGALWVSKCTPPFSSIRGYGYARVRCDDCGHDFLVAFSCKGRGVCPSCNTSTMAEAAAHLADYVLPRLPWRQLKPGMVCRDGQCRRNCRECYPCPTGCASTTLRQVSVDGIIGYAALPQMA